MIQINLWFFLISLCEQDSTFGVSRPKIESYGIDVVVRVITIILLHNEYQEMRFRNTRKLGEFINYERPV